MISFDKATLILRTGGRLTYSGCISLEKGAITVITGENGAGKSVSLAVVASVLQASSLSIVARIDGSVSPNGMIGHRLAFVRQDPLDNFISRSAADELAVPLFNHGYVQTEAQARIEQVAASLDLPLGLLNKPVGSLSGGQRQIFAIAVAASTAPDIMLLDEPLARLDDANAGLVLRALESLLPTTALVVATHEPFLYERQFPGRVMHHRVTRANTDICIQTVTSDSRASAAEDSLESRKTVAVYPGAGDTCFEVCPGTLSVLEMGGAAPLAAGASMVFNTGNNVLFGGNGAGKTLLARCIAGQIHVNSLMPSFCTLLGGLGRLLLALYAKGTLQYVVAKKLGHGNISPSLPFRTYRRLGFSAFRPAEPAWFLSEQCVRTELERFLSGTELQERLDDLAKRDIQATDRLSILSYGQKKLVMLATIPKEARLIVVDEPLSGLSERNRTALADSLRSQGAGESSSSLNRCIVITANRRSDLDVLRSACLSV